MKIYIAVTALGLESARTVKIPDRKVSRLYRFRVYGPRFTSKIFAGTVDPNVQNLDSIALIKAHVFIEKRVAFRHSSGTKRHV